MQDSELIIRLRSGDDAAVRTLFHRFFDRMMRLAAKILGPVPLRVFDEEDVALSAFESFCRALRAGRCPDMGNATNQWRLLARFTRRKVVDHVRQEAAAKRGKGQVRSSSTIEVGADESCCHGGFHELVGEIHGPTDHAIVREQFELLMEALKGDPLLHGIALARIEGYTNCEIAARFKRSRSTVDRSVRLIKQTWRSLFEVDDGGHIERRTSHPR